VQAKVSALALQREKYLLAKKMNKNRENETLAKLNDFRDSLNPKKLSNDSWMSNKLKFHIDSQRAYDVNKANEQKGLTNFENYVAGKRPREGGE